MKRKAKAAFSFITSAIFIILAGCSSSESMMKVPGRYLLNGTLSEFTDANNFAYYINGDEAYVARGANTSLTPEISSTVTLNGVTYDVTGVYHGGFANSNITGITLPLSITTIDYQAFAGSALTSAVIPCNVEEMGSGAFMNCHSLTAVQFKNDESAGSSNLGVCGAGGSSSSQEATGSSHLTTIPDYCFFNDENLTTLALPRSLTTVNSCAFQACVSLQKVAFLSSFTTLKKYAFESCTGLTDVYFPNSFTTASDDTSNCDPLAFYRAKSTCVLHLSSTDEDDYNIWSAATAWRSYNDSGSSLSLAARTAYDVGLGSDYLYRVENGEATVFSYAPSSFPASGVVVMPNSIDGYLVGKAEASTYSAYLSSLTQIYLSNNLKTISNGFFNNMTGLTTISSTGNGCYTPADNVIDLSGMSRLESVGTWLFTNSSGGNAATYLRDTFAGEVILPKSLKTIGEGAFANLKKATELSISATTPSQSLLETIGKKAFYNFGIDRASSWGDTSAVNFFDLTLPSTCTSIGEEAFSYFIGLNKIEFLGASGKSLTISKNAFAFCRSLSEIVFPAEDDAVSIGETAFYSCSSGSGHGFLDIPGIQDVYFPSSVTTIGSKAFACNERACFYFAASSKPSGVNTSFNFVSTERLGENTTAEGLNSGRDEGAAIGYIEYAPVYYGVGYLDGSTSSKRRFLKTADFSFVETEASSGEFICSRYHFKPNSLSANAKVDVTVPEYIKYSTSPTNAYDGETGTATDLKVISIGDSCFAASYSRSGRKLSTVTVPHAIKRIGDNAFARCLFFNKLSSYKGNTTDNYNFPESLKYIGRTPFILTRLRKALNIPGDVLTFDMIDPSELAAGRIPVSFATIDKWTPRALNSSAYQPRRYGTIFANDWYLDEVTFTTVASPNFSVDTTTKAIYRLNKIGNGGTLSADIQLLMVMARLKSYNVDSTTKESSGSLIDSQNIIMGDTGYEFMTGMSSIHYGAFKVATWLKGLKLDTSMDLFPKYWNSSTALPQSLFCGINDFPTYCQIGGTANDKTYFINCQSLSFISSGGNFALPADVARCCTNLTSMTFPKNLTSIPLRAFDQATGISSWITPNSSDVLTEGGEEGGSGVLDLRNNTGLTEIGRSAFYGNTVTTKLYTPPNLTTLGDMVWQENAALTYVDMSSSTQLTGLSEKLFLSATTLGTVILPPNLVSVGAKDFQYVPITSITWPANDTLTTIAANAFEGNRIENLIIPDSVTNIKGGAFKNGTATKIVRLPASWSDIISDAFSGCKNVNQVYFENPVTGAASRKNLGNNLFGPNVKYALLADTVGVGNAPFNNCTDLRAIFYGRKLANIGASEQTTFTHYKGGSKDATLYYYAESAADLIDANSHYWKFKPGSTTTVQEISPTNFNTVIREYDFTTLLS